MTDNLIINFILLIVGFAMLKYGADWLVNGASAVAKKIGIPSIIVGLTICSIGTSMPELMVSTASALSGSSDLSLGNIVGSNIANMCMVLGPCAIMATLPFDKNTAKTDMPFMLVLTVLLYVFCFYFGDGITRIEGIILLVITVLYIAYNVYKALKLHIESEEIEEMKTSKAVILIILGIVALKFGGDFVCDNAQAIALSLGVPEKVIGCTIVAVATSLPELVTSVTATKKGEVDIAIGNIVGSNIFNICLIIGTASTISPMTGISSNYIYDFIWLITVTVLLCVFPFIKKRYEMVKWEGILFACIYVGYLVYSVLMVI